MIKNEGVEIENPSIEQIKEYLAKIGWSLSDQGCDFMYLRNHKDEIVDWFIWHDRLEFKTNYNLTCYFALKAIKIKLMTDGTAVAFTAIGSANNVFLLCMNHDMKKIESNKK